MARVLFLFSCCLPLLLQAQQSSNTYWQQEVNYSIDVALNDQLHSLDGFITLEYSNHSPDTISFIWFHLWPNAYKNDKTAFSDQLLENGKTDFYFSDEEDRGYINRIEFQVNNTTARIEDHPSHIDIVKLILPEPLAPGKSISIQTAFHVQLPAIFSRSGHDGQHYQIAQWFPRPAVYDQQGWHEMPYLDQGEFYGEFGNFDVRITVPENYVVAASGILQDEKEKNWLQTRQIFSWIPEKKKIKTQGGVVKTITEKFPPSSAKTKTLHYKLTQAHDFAWFADKRFLVKQDSVRLTSGKIIEVAAFYLQEAQEQWDAVLAYSKKGLQMRSSWIGDYPYSQFSVVQSAVSNGGGMEYPAITLISPVENDKLLHYIVTHEAGHNWFQAALGSNERAYPWLDEGLNSYYDNRYSRYLYGDSGELRILKARVSIQDFAELLVENAANTYTDQPINLSSDHFTSSNYNLIAYSKAAAWLEWLEQYIGTDDFDKAIRDYYQQWQFKHPKESDLKEILEKTSGRNLDSAFALLTTTGKLPGPPRKGIQVGLVSSAFTIQNTFRGNAAHKLLISPAAGYNSYDKFMIGGLFTNITLPIPRLQYLFAPLYTTGSKTLAGLGLINYSHYPKNRKINRVDLGLSGGRFTINEFTDPEGNQLHFGMTKLVPGIRMTLRERNARSTRERYIQFKSFLIQEEGLRFSRDSVFTGADTLIVNSYRKEKENRTLHQLKLVWEDFRVLYPYKAELKLEQGKDFLRAAFTGNYFFNYAREGGLKFRFFAGKFFYTTAKTFNKQFETDRYHLNMTGANGYEDYTYSDYFFGRNEFEGAASQQIMERDGAFKTRTDLLASKVGRSDDWLIAMNFSSTIPSRLNPLSLLPFKIPLKVFADIGTYAGAWDRDANTDRFLFDAGLQLSLLKETVHIYLPLIYSQPFKDYIQSTIPKKERLLKKISFSINLSNFSFRKLNRNLAF